jgi:hypothetical protein
MAENPLKEFRVLPTLSGTPSEGEGMFSARGPKYG